MSRNLASIICAAIVAMIIVSAPASAARRALVIGIDNYAELPKLEKAAGDAAAIAETLEGLGFSVDKVINARRRDISRAISRFTRSLGRDDVALVHFSGHGVEVNGENYLLPADIPKPGNGEAGLVQDEGIAMSRLVARVAGSGVRTRLFIIDACRNNPFQQSGVRAIGGSRGLARVEAPAGTFIMYSAGYRQTALDRLGDNDPVPTSVYTRVLVKKLKEAGKPISAIAREVRVEVEKLARTVGHDQRPAYYDELSAGLVLKPAQAVAVDRARATTSRQAEIAYWQAVEKTGNASLFRNYLKKYPNGLFADVARVKIAALDARPGTANKADTAGKTDKADKNTAGAPPTSGDTGKETKQAALTPPAQEPAGDKPKSRRERVREAQTMLAEMGCRPGPVDGAWGPASRLALKVLTMSFDFEIKSYGFNTESMRQIERLYSQFKAGEITGPVCKDFVRKQLLEQQAAARATPEATPEQAPQQAEVPARLRRWFKRCMARIHNRRRCAAIVARGTIAKSGQTSQASPTGTRQRSSRKRRFNDSSGSQCGVCQGIRVCGFRYREAVTDGLCG